MPPGQLWVAQPDPPGPSSADHPSAADRVSYARQLATKLAYVEPVPQASHAHLDEREPDGADATATRRVHAVLRQEVWRPAMRARAAAVPRPPRQAALMSGGSGSVRGDRVAAHFHYVPSYTREIVRAARSGLAAAVPEPQHAYIDPARVKDGYCIASAGQSQVFTASIRSKRSACPPTAAIKKVFRTQQDAHREINALNRLRHAGIVHLFGLVQQPPLPPDCHTASAHAPGSATHQERRSQSDSITAAVPPAPAILIERYSCSLAQALDAAALAGGALHEPQSPSGMNAYRNTTTLSDADEMVLMACVPSALAYAHRRGVVHEDVKPDNVLLRRGRRGALVAALADWGMAVELRRERPQSARSVGRAHGRQMFNERLLGTPGYVAPEQLRLPFALAYSADVYSWGMVLAEMALWTAPWIGATEYGVALAAVRGVQTVPAHSVANCGVAESGGLGRLRPSAHRRAILAGHVWCTTHDPRSRPDMAQVMAAYSEIAADAAVHGGRYSVAFIETMARSSRGSCSYAMGRARPRQRCVAAADAAAASAAFDHPGAHVSLPSVGLVFTGLAPVMRPATEEDVEAGVFASAAPLQDSWSRSGTPLAELYRSSTDEDVATPGLAAAHMHGGRPRCCTEPSSARPSEGVRCSADLPHTSKEVVWRDFALTGSAIKQAAASDLASARQGRRSLRGVGGTDQPLAPGSSVHRPPHESPEATPSCVTSVATLTDAALLPQPPSRRFYQPTSTNDLGAEAPDAPAAAVPFRSSGAFQPGGPFQPGGVFQPGGAFHSGTLNSGAFSGGIYSSSVLYSSTHNSGPFGGGGHGGHHARSSTAELYNSVALKKGVLVEFRGGSIEASEPSTRIGAARTATLPRGYAGNGHGGSREASGRVRGSHSTRRPRTSHASRTSLTAPPARVSTDDRPSRRSSAFSRLSTAVAAAARARCACMRPGHTTRAHPE